jgi:hypothetical protein
MPGLIVLDESSDNIGLLISENRFPGYDGKGSLHDRGIYGADAALKLNLYPLCSPELWNGFGFGNGLDVLTEEDLSRVRALQVTFYLYKM